MTDINEVIEELRARLLAATPGPWGEGQDDVRTNHPDHQSHLSGMICDVVSKRHGADQAVIVSAVNALPALLDHIAELEGRVKALEAMIDRAIDPHHNKPYGSFSDFAWARLEDLTTARQALDAPTKDGGG